MTNTAVPGLDAVADATPLFEGAYTRVGVFDSGLGGLSVLRALRERLPRADLTYVADSGHAPYGERDDDFITSRSQGICEFLIGREVDAIVVACNTATAAAIHILRAAHPHLPIIGVEPGVKPAVARSRSGRIGVVATPSTLESGKFRRLIEAHGQGVVIVPQACPGLAREIERGQLDTPALRALVARFCQPLLAARVDTVVLGCTHYPFVLPLFQETLGEGIEIMDTAQAVAQHTMRLCAQRAAVRIEQPGKPLPESNGTIELWTSGDPAYLAHAAHHWLGLNGEVSRLV